MVGLLALRSGDLASARTAAAAASTRDVPDLRDNALVLLGVIALRQGDVPAAKEAFRGALRHTDELLTANPRNFDALDSKGLAAAGIAICGGGNAEASINAYAAAREISDDPGVVARAILLLDQIQPVDPGELPRNVRQAARGHARR